MSELRDIPGFEGRYAATADGRIWSHGRKLWLKQWKSGNGYLGVDIDAKTRKVHRLVALAWIPNPENLPQINHLDGNKKNNAHKNIEWCTGSDNVKHAIRTGLARPRGSAGGGGRKFSKGNRYGARLTADEVSIIKARLARQEKQVDLAAEFGVTDSSINRIHLDQSWRDVAPAKLA